MPLSRWLSEDLADMMRDTLVSERKLAPWFDQREIERYVTEHVSGRASHASRLWPLFVMALWIDRLKVAM